MLKQLKRGRVLLFLLLILYFAVAYSLMKHYDITCVFIEAFGIPCPGCGMTRAFLSLLKLDFYHALKYNIVIFFMPYVFIYVFFDLKHKVHNVILMGIGVVAIINWIIKIVNL